MTKRGVARREPHAQITDAEPKYCEGTFGVILRVTLQRLIILTHKGMRLVTVFHILSIKHKAALKWLLHTALRVINFRFMESSARLCAAKSLRESGGNLACFCMFLNALESSHYGLNVPLLSKPLTTDNFYSWTISRSFGCTAGPFLWEHPSPLATIELLKEAFWFTGLLMKEAMPFGKL